MKKTVVIGGRRRPAKDGSTLYVSQFLCEFNDLCHPFDLPVEFLPPGKITLTVIDRGNHLLTIQRTPPAWKRLLWSEGQPRISKILSLSYKDFSQE